MGGEVGYTKGKELYSQEDDDKTTSRVHGEERYRE